MDLVLESILELIWNSILDVISESISITISDRIVGTSFCLFLQNLHHLFLHRSRESKSTNILGPIISSTMTLLTISPKTNNTIIQLPLRIMKAKPSQEKRMHTSLLSIECQCENYLQPSHTSRNMRWIYTCYLFVVFLLLCVFFVWKFSFGVILVLLCCRESKRHAKRFVTVTMINQIATRIIQEDKNSTRRPARERSQLF